MSYEHARQIGKSSASAMSSSASEPTGSVVGKQTLAEQHAAGPGLAGLAQVKARAGAVVVDAGGFEYVVTPDGGFRITFAPSPWERSVGAVITITGKYATAWATLANLLETTNDEQQCVEPAPAEHAPEMSIGQPAPSTPSTPDTDAPAPSPIADTTDLYWIATTTCKVKSEKGANVSPPQVLTQFVHVRVLATKQFRDFTNAKIAHVDPTGGVGAEIGWASLQHMVPVRRPKRPSSAAAQMAAVLAAARAVAGNEPAGWCYANVKKHILGGGGYGDILDIQQDERFVGLLAEAVMFHTAVQKIGAAALGLEEVGGLPMNASPGTLLVLRGTASNGIDRSAGDISVIDGVQGGVLVCYNDGKMRLQIDEAAWSTGTMAGSLVAMYKPIDRG